MNHMTYLVKRLWKEITQTVAVVVWCVRFSQNGASYLIVFHVQRNQLNGTERKKFFKSKPIWNRSLRLLVGTYNVPTLYLLMCIPSFNLF